MFNQYLIICLVSLTVTSFSFREKEINDGEKNKIIRDLKIEINEKKFNGFFADSIKINFKTSEFNKTIVLFKSSRGSKFHPLLEDTILNDQHNDNINENLNYLSDKIAFYHDQNYTCCLTLIKKSMDKSKALGTCHGKKKFYSFLPVDLDTRRHKRSNLENPHLFIERAKNHENVFDFIKIDSELKNEIFDSKNLKNKENITNYLIEILVVTDYSVYQLFEKVTKINNEKALLIYMKIYFTQLINEVNFKYLNSFNDDTELRISVKLKNFLFSTKPNESKWSNRKRVGINEIPFYKQKEVILADDTLLAFSEFMINTKLNYTYDHAVGITSKDLWSSDQYLGPETRSMTSGMAYFGRICSPKYKFSIIEDNTLLRGTITLAHEIGHNLGSDHDGIKGLYKSCKETDGFIMSPIALPTLNGNKFSNCSIEAIKNYMLKNSDSQCLSEVDDFLKFAEIENVENSSLGTFWDLDEQCKTAFGINASFCKDIGDNLCLNLYCRENDTLDYCTSVGGALQGSICDSGKTCVHSECVSDKISSSNQNECLFGDDAVIKDYFTNESFTCENFIENMIIKSNFSQNDCVNNEWVKRKCCSTCKIYRKMTCFDKYSNCDELKDYCELSDNIKLNCPKTCGICSTKITCQSDENLCKNGGTCMNIGSNSIKSFKCVCKNEYSGQYCEKKNPCIPNPCSSDKNCYKIGKNGYICS